MPAPTKATKATSRTPRASTLSPRQRLRRRVLLGAILALEVVMLGYVGASVVAAMSLMAPDPLPDYPDPCGLWLALPDGELPQPYRSPPHPRLADTWSAA